MNVYYAQRVYSERNDGRGYASTMDDLADLVDEAVIGPFRIEIVVSDERDGYVATVMGNPDGSIVTVTDERLLVVTHPDRAVPS
jgi:hypothetical protein